MNDRVTLQASVPQGMHGNRLDQAAAELFPQYSRSRLQEWIKKGHYWLMVSSADPEIKC